MAPHPQHLRAALDARQAGNCAVRYPAVLVAVYAFEIVPIAQQMLFVTGQGKIDDVLAIAWIQLFALGRRKQVVHLPLVGSLVSARAPQLILYPARERPVTIRATEKRLKICKRARYRRRSHLFAHSGERAAKPPCRAPFGS